MGVARTGVRRDLHGFGGYRVEAAGWVIAGAVGRVTRTAGGTWSGSINSTVIMSLLGVMGPVDRVVDLVTDLRS